MNLTSQASHPRPSVGPRAHLRGALGISCAFGFLVAWGSAASAADPGEAQRVARAEQFSSANLLAKVRNNAIAFHWIGNSDRFWFRKFGNNGQDEFVIVDAATGRQGALFDAAALTAALALAGRRDHPRIVAADVSANAQAIRLSLPKLGAPCSWPVAPGRCTVPTTVFQCDLPVSRCSALPDRPLDVVPSPDGKRLAFVRDHNLWIRELQDGVEWPLTTGGVAHFAYGETHIQLDDGHVARRRAGLPEPLTGILWSPDGRHILAIRHDLRGVPERETVTEYLPPEGGRPFVHTQRLAIASDPQYPKASVEILDLDRRTVTRSDADPFAFGDFTALYYVSGHVWWSADAVSMVSFRRGARDARLMRIDLHSGRATDQITETSSSTLIANRNALTGPNVKLLAGGKEAIWFSERDGWGHLYLYDLSSGRVERQITSGRWRVVDLVGVDERSRTAFFTAVGREAGRNPYYRYLYRVSLDGGAPTLLTPENADHDFGEDFVFSGGSAQGGSLSPSLRYFLDVYSTTSQPDHALLRRVDGSMIADVIQADISALRAVGWRPPEQVTAKAADGTTDLYGVLYKPVSFNPAKHYPIIEITYPAPGFKFTPVAFWENFTLGTTLNAYAFAELGTVVVAVDGRGGGLRSRAFRETFYGSDDPTGAVDHVAFLRHLAGSRAYLDLRRVGVTGHSFGGYASLRAMLLHPDFYKVGVSGEGNADLAVASIDVATERLFGVPTDPATKAYYRRISNESIADRLKGKLLLIYGGADESVPLQNAFQIFMALQKADKSYDTLIMADSPHYGGREPYGVRRTLEYFAHNLGGPR